MFVLLNSQGEKNMLKRTPLYDKHLQLGGKMTNFGGWELPVQYTGIIDEHLKVRSDAGLFDVSHMGEIWVTGAGAEAFLQKLVTNDISRAAPGKAVYSPVCYPDGGTVDDLIVYKYAQDRFLLVVNASNTDKDFDWILKNLPDDCTAENKSDEYAQLALQGPRAERILQKLTDVPLNTIRFFNFVPEAVVGGVKVMISRSGYTGEDGFELYFDRDRAVELWDKIMDAGSEEGLVPAGLGARDTLRFEAALPLYGHELSEEITPLEAGLGRFVKLDKPDFIGKTALEKQKSEGVPRLLAGFEMIDKGVPRSQYTVEVGGETVGYVTSGSYAPSLGKNFGLAILKAEYAVEGQEIDVVIRGRRMKARVVRLPFYSKKYAK